MISWSEEILLYLCLNLNLDLDFGLRPKRPGLELRPKLGLVSVKFDSVPFVRVSLRFSLCMFVHLVVDVDREDM